MQHKKPDPFYLLRAWRELREAALARDNWLCQRCLGRGRLTTADLVHHILPRETHPELELVLDNLMSLCIGCHNYIHDREIEQEPVKRKARIIKG